MGEVAEGFELCFGVVGGFGDHVVVGGESDAVFAESFGAAGGGHGAEEDGFEVGAVFGVSGEADADGDLVFAKGCAASGGQGAVGDGGADLFEFEEGFFGFDVGEYEEEYVAGEPSEAFALDIFMFGDAEGEFFEEEVAPFESEDVVDFGEVVAVDDGEGEGGAGVFGVLEEFLGVGADAGGVEAFGELADFVFGGDGWGCRVGGFFPGAPSFAGFGAL